MSLLQFYLHCTIGSQPGTHWRTPRAWWKAAGANQGSARGQPRAQNRDKHKNYIPHCTTGSQPGTHWRPARARWRAAGGPTRCQLGDNQEHKIEINTNIKFHMVRSLTSRSNLSLVQIRNQSFTISCLSDSREDTGQTSLCGFKLLTTNNIMLNYEHPWDIRQNGHRDKIDTLHDIEQIICKKKRRLTWQTIFQEDKNLTLTLSSPSMSMDFVHTGCGILNWWPS